MRPVQVSQVNKYIKTVLQSDPLLSNISVIGEVSNLKYHGTGHVYFSMKDKGSRINCFLPADKARHLRYPLEEGMEIIASGYIYLYEKGGSYSLNVSDIRIEGEGNLAAAFERLKQKLNAEGLFSQEYKKPIPVFPRSVGIVTSATGAAVWDMIRTIKNKNDYVDIILCPCLVQGDGAAGDVEDAIKALNRMEYPPDVIIVGRGGGSTEELWAFNEERVARSIFASDIPVISAVGHETDFTIADFVADLRAATPTAAAEAAVPDMRDIRANMESFISESKRAAVHKTEFLENALEMHSKENLITVVENKMSGYENELDSIMKDVVILFKEKIYKEELKIEKLKGMADSMDPVKILSLGYGAVTDKDGRFIRSTSEVKTGETINVRIKDGSMNCVINDIRKEEVQDNG
ncbi:MAG: exodeoxyribonuclease VII large subunit [Clostridiales bacterium]|nr:exodeoxyribonuclease VII large subunit [Clostridiales bacterium]